MELHRDGRFTHGENEFWKVVLRLVSWPDLVRGRVDDEGSARACKRCTREHAFFEVGCACANGDGAPKDSARACELFQLAADGGHAGAAYRLGLMYRNGTGVAKDFAET